MVHLDRVYWKPGWVEPSGKEWAESVGGLLRADSWILDGNYGGTMEMRMNRADTVFWLDLSPAVCVYRVIKRSLNLTGGRRPDIADGCDERLDANFVRYVWRFRKDTRPRIVERVQRFENQLDVVRFTSKHEPDEYLSRLKSESDAKNV